MPPLDVVHHEPQRIATIQQAYAVGERQAQIHDQQTDVTWLTTHVIGLASPVRLSLVAEEQELELVAWSALAAGAPEELGEPDGLVQVASTGTGSD